MMEPHLTLADLVAPEGVDDFLSNSFGIKPSHYRGSSTRFSSLLPWVELNRILEQHRLDDPRVRLIADGSKVPPSAFIAQIVTQRGTVPRLRPEAVRKILGSGAVLVFDYIDETYSPITTLCDDLSVLLGEYVSANAYIGLKESKGFDLHQDGHEVLVLQVHGRKRWEVYGRSASRPPASSVVWEGNLEAGDVLSIPSGCWHAAQALDEPTLHLTLSIRRRTGLDLLAWLTTELRTNSVLNSPLLAKTSPREIRPRLVALTDEIRRQLTPDLFERYLESHRRTIRRRQPFMIPYSDQEVDN